jgi:hypothetical protein
VIALGSSPDERRRVKRSCRVAVLDLTQSPSEPPPPDHPWARLVYQVLAARRISYFASQMSRLLSASPAASAASLAAAILEGMETPSRAGSR